MTDHNPLENKLLTLLYDRPLPARELRQQLGNISPATLSRITKQIGPKIVSFGKARASRYARPRDLRGIGTQLPVYLIDESGNAHFAGELCVLCGGYWWAGEESASRYYPSVPWFLYDLKPDGFVGRAFAQQFRKELGLPERLTSWKDDDILVALARRGEDAVGDLLVGEESLARYMSAARIQPVICTAADYPRLAEEALAGDPAGSSAGGEQPKFSVLTEREGGAQQVLVKFSPLLSTHTGQRWSDLLVAEHIALNIVREMGIASAASTIHQVGNRTFLEVERFDRVGIRGRTPLNSLTFVDAEYIGAGSNWTATADKLAAANMLSPEDAVHLRRLDLFGSLIANSDRHQGNISLVPTNRERTRFRLAPAYDMLPMFYRPKEGEELPAGAYHLPAAGDVGEVYECAGKFWREAGNDPRISAPFRKLCGENHDILLKMGSGPRIIRP